MLGIYDEEPESFSISENEANSKELEALENEMVLVQEITFNQLLFVAQDFNVTTKGIVSPNLFSIFTGDNTRSFPLSSVFAIDE